MQIDHVMYGVRDLDEARSWFEHSYGLTAVSGGVHPDAGTANAILPVGDDQYVELIAVVDPQPEHPLARVLAALVSEGDRPVAVCVRPDDLNATAQRLGLEVSDAARANPDGVVLHWRMVGLPAALGPDRLPFFIEWPGGGGTPELDGVRDTVGDGIEWVEIGGDSVKLQRWLDADLPTVRSIEGPPGIQRFSLIGANGSVIIGAR